MRTADTEATKKAPPQAPNFSSWVLIGLGSNQGDSGAVLQWATQQLLPLAQSDQLCSSLWRTAPVDCPPGSPDFLNATLAFLPAVDLTPESLLRQLKSLERECGRSSVNGRNAPRILDLDLLVFGREQRHWPWFQLPHPRAIERHFVLLPAAEIVPDLEWPGTGFTVSQLLAELLAKFGPAEGCERLGLN